MALRNAFENLAVESKQDSIIAELQNLVLQMADPATETKQDDIITAINIAAAELQTNPLTDAQLRASDIGVHDSSKILFTDYTTSLADGAELDSGWMDLETWERYQFTSKSAVAGMTQIIESSPIFPATAGSTLTSNNIIDRGFNYFAVGAREQYMRFRWRNETGAPVNNVSLTIKGIKAEGQSVLALSQQPSDFSLSTLTQAIIYGLNEVSGGREQVALSGNNNLLVALGDRISQTGGRARNEVRLIGLTASGLGYTVPADHNFYVTSINWSGVSTSTTAPVRALIRDGGAAGAVKYSFGINEPTAFAQQADNGDQTYPEPLLFETNIYFELATGGFTGDIFIVGYLEPI